MIVGKFKTIDQYINSFPKAVQLSLKKLRQIVNEIAPDAQESISYGMPTFKLKGVLLHFAAYKTHIGLYPGPNAITAFKKELSPFDLSKGTIRFPVNKPLSLPLITKIVKYKVRENLKK